MQPPSVISSREKKRKPLPPKGKDSNLPEKNEEQLGCDVVPCTMMSQEFNLIPLVTTGYAPSATLFPYSNKGIRGLKGGGIPCY